MADTAARRPGRRQAIRSVLVAVLVVDLALAMGKGVYGLLSGSLGLVSDGLHSALHAAGAVVGLVGVTLAARPPDEDHPYGYERYETLASMGIASFMLLAVWKILEDVWARLRSPAVARVDEGSFALMGGALALTVLLALWERRRGRRLESPVLQADALRRWSDLLVSSSVLGGLVAVRLGAPLVDSLVSVPIAGMIGWSAWRIARDASRVLTDAAVGDIGRIETAARSIEGVADCHQVRARGVGGSVRVDLHVTVDPEMTVAESHRIAEEVERRVREGVEGVAEVLVHVGASTLHAQDVRPGR